MLAVAGAFALTMGARQTMGLFLSSLNSATHLGGGDRGLRLAGSVRGLVAGDGLGGGALAHEVAAVAGVRRPGGGGAGLLVHRAPTAGLLAKFFGVGNMVTLFGLVMLTHQLGGFLGAWLGGKVFEATGNCDVVWTIDITLAVAAGVR